MHHKDLCDSRQAKLYYVLFTSPNYIFTAGLRIETCDLTVATVTSVTLILPMGAECTVCAHHPYIEKLPDIALVQL